MQWTVAIGIDTHKHTHVPRSAVPNSRAKAKLSRG